MKSIINKNVFEKINIGLIGIITILSGFINIFSSITPSIKARLGFLYNFVPMEISNGARFVTIFFGIFLIFLSINLFRRKKTAWILAFSLFIFSIILNLIKGFDYEEAIFFLILTFWILKNRKYYNVLSDKPSIKKGILIAIISFIFIFAYGFIGLYVVYNKHNIEMNVLDISKNVFNILMNSNIKNLEQLEYKKFIFSFDFMFVILCFYSFFKIVQPILIKNKPSREERLKAEEIIKNKSKSLISNFCLIGNKNYFFTKHNSLIAYKTSGRGCLVLGDPIGEVEFIEDDLNEFIEFGNKNDWNIYFYETSGVYLDVYKKFNFENFKIGREAVVDSENFTLDGHENKKIRSIVKKIKDNYSFNIYNSPIDNSLIYKLKNITNDWLSAHNKKENGGFSMGCISDEYIKSTTFFTVENKQGEIEAFLNIIENKNNNEIGVDLMRRRINSENNGVMEFLFVELINYAKSKNIKNVNLGLSPFYLVGEDKKDKMMEKFFNFIYKNLNSIYNFKGLSLFKEKFNPNWEPKYLVYKEGSNFINMGILIIKVNYNIIPKISFNKNKDIY